MNKYLKALLVILAVIAGYFLVLQLFPKNAGRYPFFVILLAGDYYLWLSVKAWIKSRKRIPSIIYTFLYWLPFALLVVSSLVLFRFSDRVWNENVRIYIFGFIFAAYASKLLPIIFLLLADVFRGFRLFHKGALKLSKKVEAIEPSEDSKISRSKFLQQMGLITGGVLFSGLLLGMLRWAFDFKIHKHVVRINDLPLQFNNLRIVQISDMHLGGWTSKSALVDVVNRINDLKPDLIFFTGDLVNNKTDEAYPFEAILSGFKAKMGVYTILGNHDYGDYIRWPSSEAKQKNLTDLVDFYKRIGWKLLNNQNEVFGNGDGKLAVIGVENWGDFGRFPKYGDLGKAIKGAENAKVKLLLSHDPSHWDRIVINDFKDIDITFSGHTHGFQFGIEVKNFKWSPAQYVYKNWAGLYENENGSAKKQWLYVNRGLGTVGYPGRVGILPEITLMELKRA
jgi:uncharacterized protein